jgi:hypothetical protein
MIEGRNMDVRFLFVCAEEVYAIEDMAIRPNNVRAVLLHLRTSG